MRGFSKLRWLNLSRRIRDLNGVRESAGAGGNERAGHADDPERGVNLLAVDRDAFQALFTNLPPLRGFFEQLIGMRSQ
jgi:hypothetical protein